MKHGMEWLETKDPNTGLVVAQETTIQSLQESSGEGRPTGYTYTSHDSPGLISGLIFNGETYSTIGVFHTFKDAKLAVENTYMDLLAPQEGF